MTLTVIEPPWEVHTPRGKADVLAVIDYSQESYVYFLTAQRGTGEFWVYRNDKCQLFWNESTGLGKKEESVRAPLEPAWYKDGEGKYRMRQPDAKP